MEMGVQVIINARTLKASVSLDAPNEGTAVFAVDLIGDTWDDFGYFIAQAAHYEKAQQLRLRNRYVRVAIAAVFTHFDGVVSDLFDILRKEVTFGPYLPHRPDFCSLKAKVGSIEHFLRTTRAITLPAMDLGMKLLRDIVNHPSITKDSRSDDATDTIQYDGADVYGIDINDLTATGAAINRWLSAACVAIGYERFRDTKALAENLMRGIVEAHKISEPHASEGNPSEF